MSRDRNRWSTCRKSNILGVLLFASDSTIINCVNASNWTQFAHKTDFVSELFLSGFPVPTHQLNNTDWKLLLSAPGDIHSAPKSDIINWRLMKIDKFSLLSIFLVYEKLIKSQLHKMCFNENHFCWLLENCLLFLACVYSHLAIYFIFLFRLCTVRNRFSNAAIFFCS